MSRVKKWIHGIIRRISIDHVNAYASQTAYFVVLSALPFIIFMLTMLRYSPLSYDDLMNMISTLAPSLVNDVTKSLFQEVYARSNLTLISITIIFVVWASGSGIMSITKGINEIYHIHETRSWFYLRAMSSLYTAFLAIALILTLGLLVFGKFIYNRVSELLPIIHQVFVFVISIRTIVIFTLLTIFFIFIYKILPNKKMRFFHVLPGAVLCAVGWIVTTGIYSVYFSLSRNFSYMYGSLAGIMALMLWLYVCMFQLFLGAEINNMIHPESISGDSLAVILDEVSEHAVHEDEKRKEAASHTTKYPIKK